MSHNFSYIYSKKSAATILNCKVSNILRVEIWANCIWVLTVKGSPKFISKRKFTALFASNRQQAGKDIADIGAVDHVKGGLFTVISQSANEVYHIELDTDHLECNCADYGIQRNDLGLSKATCKHGYAVLNVLGYATLSEYIKKDGFYKAMPLELAM